jgi:hypothetical protein
MLLESGTVLENLRIACQAFHSSRHSVFHPAASFPEVIGKARRCTRVLRKAVKLEDPMKAEGTMDWLHGQLVPPK